MEGITVGMEGMFGNEAAGSGGRLACGIVGMLGMVGMVGRGGSLGIGREGCGRFGIVGKGGNFPSGRFGKGGNIGFGKFGTVGVAVCRRWRASRPLSMLESERTIKRAKIKEEAMACVCETMEI